MCQTGVNHQSFHGVVVSGLVVVVSGLEVVEPGLGLLEVSAQKYDNDNRV